MLVRSPEYKLIEKTITTKSGSVVSVLVAVTYYENRVVSARIIAVRPLEAPTEALKPILLTSCEECEILSSICTLSLYTQFFGFDFSFLTSQPTRAPALAYSR